MIFASYLNTSKNALYSNDEIINCFIPYKKENDWIYHDRYGEKIDLMEPYLDQMEDLPEMQFIHKLNDIGQIPGSNQDGFVISGAYPDQEYVFQPLIPLFPIKKAPAFTRIADTLDLNLNSLKENLVSIYRKGSGISTKDFIDVFQSYDPLLITIDVFWGELKSIYDKENTLANLKARDIEEIITDALEPLYALQAYGLAYSSSPDVYGDAERFDSFCNVYYKGFSFQNNSFVHSFSKGKKNLQKNLLNRFIQDPENLGLAVELIDTVPYSGENLRDGEYFFCCKSYIDLLYNCFRLMLMLKMPLKKCINCGKSFVAIKRSDMDYCNRPSPQDPERICRVIGPNKRYHQAVSESDTLKNERRLYNLLLNRCKRHPNDIIYRKNFDLFVAENKKRKKNWKKDAVIHAEYDKWLEEMILKYKKEK